MHPAPARTHRLFVALDPPDEVRVRLAALAGEAAARLGGRAVAPANLHLTLCFLGAVDPARVPAVASAVTRALRGARAPTVRVVGLEGTPGPGAGRVCAARLGDEDGALAEAWSAVRARVPAAAGSAPGDAALWPHITLVRLGRPTPVPFFPVDGEHAFVFRRASLYDSRTDHDGPRYTSLVDVPLVVTDHPD